VNRDESAESLDDLTRAALVDLLVRLADDELILGHRDSEWTGHAPILEEDVAFSSIAQDEMGHAQAYYGLLHQLGEADPDTLAFARPPRDFRCASLVSLPNDDWALSLVRQFLYDAAENVRLSALCESTYLPLAQLARKLRGEEKYHLMHGRTWMLRLGQSTDTRGNKRMQAALDKAYPHALGLFEPTEFDVALDRKGICPSEEELCCRWASAIVPVLSEAGLEAGTGVRPVYGGRIGRHPDSLTDLLKNMQVVFNIDPAAKW